MITNLYAGQNQFNGVVKFLKTIKNELKWAHNNKKWLLVDTCVWMEKGSLEGPLLTSLYLVDGPLNYGKCVYNFNRPFLCVCVCVPNKKVQKGWQEIGQKKS